MKHTGNTAKPEKKERKLSLWKGILGAIVGGIVGLALWMLIAYYFVDRLHLCGAFLATIFIYYGYRLFGGKRGTAAVVTVSVTSLIVAVLGF